jgi:hypothetical protein
MVLVPYPADKLARLAGEYAVCNGEKLERQDVARMMGGPDGQIAPANVAQWFKKNSPQSDIPENRLALLTEALKQKGVDIKYEWWELPLDEFDARRDGGQADQPGRLFFWKKNPWSATILLSASRPSRAA